MRWFNKLLALALAINLIQVDAQTLGPPNGGTKLGAVLQATPANPTGSTSSTGVMMGLGSTCTITPIYSTKVNINFIGMINSSVANDSSIIKLFFGTGTAPTNQAAITGTQIGPATGISVDESTAGFNSIFPVGGIISALTPGTPYWFDISLAHATTGTITATRISCAAFEVP